MPLFRAIAIDGPAASGKSTLARELSKHLGLIMVNSGAMYRAITKTFLDQGIQLQEDQSAQHIDASLPNLTITCGVDENNQSIIQINGITHSPESLKSASVNGAVSIVAAHPLVRERLLDLQRNYLALGDLVMEGRDIGSVIFPDTPYKFYVQASEEIRQQRRLAEGLQDSLAQRDQQDSQRTSSPLVVAPDAIIIDSTHLTISQMLEHTLSLLNQQGWQF